MVYKFYARDNTDIVIQARSEIQMGSWPHLVLLTIQKSAMAIITRGKW